LRLSAPVVAEALFRKVAWRVLLPIAVLTFVNAIDRMNLSFAGSALSQELGLSPSSFGLGVSYFFIAYLLFQYPHAVLLRAWGIRRWLLLSVCVWGVASFAMAYVQTATQFYAARFLLGMAEAGFAPGMTYFISLWTPRALRARAISFALAAVPLSLVLGGPLCGALLAMQNPLGLAPWRWMYWVMAFPNLLLAVAAYFYFVERPKNAAWLTKSESDLLEAQQPQAKTAAIDIWRVVAKDPRVWGCALTWLCVMTGSYALVYWLPQLVRQLALSRGEFWIATLSALPQAALAVGLLVNAWHSDRKGERLWHVGIAAAFAGLALWIAAAVPAGALTLGLLVLAGGAIGAAQGVFWAVPTALGIGDGQPPVEVIALVSMFGTAGGVIGPWLLGALIEHTGNFSAGIGVLAGLLLAGAVIVVSLRRFIR
jgi:MFS transporter, ACS family, tartrate transporter